MGDEGEEEVEVAIPGPGADTYEGNELLHIASTMPHTDIDVVRRRIGKMDNFRELATDALDVLERHHHATLGANSQSQEWFHRACQDTRDIFRVVLAQDLEWEQQRYVLDLLMRLLQMEGAKDTESRNLLSSLSDKLSNKMMVIGGVAITAAAVVVTVGAPKAARQIAQALRRD
ncbi:MULTISPECIES: hypothetical protein [Micromonospora]|uniref:Uncharacterized protein n=1 Tax=Micromonospora echinospora TaxID=1877 RepID=A0ABR6M575_MICEC|nr:MULTISPECIES: hypothetical protein [Micromonospora]MBB5110529.1 hypothetical protein [Micromonospora echinospora]NLU78174.1 hypothetical protein [Micromonospora sp. HNM0581]